MNDIKKRISDLGIKQVWLADKLGVSHIQLNYWLNETRPIPSEVKSRLVDLLSKLEAIA